MKQDSENKKLVDKLIVKISNSAHHTDPYKQGYKHGATKVFEELGPQVETLTSENERLKEENKSLKENLCRILDRIKESNLQGYFPSAFARAETLSEIYNKEVWEGKEK